MAKKPTKKIFYIKSAETGDIMRIAASTRDEAFKISDTMDPYKAPIVVPKPGGEGYFVNPDDGSALVMQPDGRELIMGSGFSTSDPERVAAYKEGQTAGSMATSDWQKSILSAAEEQSPLGRATGPVVAASQAMGFGSGAWLDEVVEKYFGGKSGDALRAIKQAQQSERPVETLIAQLGVGLTEGYALLKRLPQLANIISGTRQRGTLASTAVSGAAGLSAGGTTGFISGAGEADPDENRIRAGGEGAVIGAVAGGTLGAVTPLVAAGGRNILNLLRKSDVPMIAGALRISKQAAEVIKSAFDAGGDIDQALLNLERAGETGMLADAGPAAQALLDASVSVGGQGQVVTRALGQRADDVTAGLSQTLDKTLGDADLTPLQAAEMISAKTAEPRKKAYDAAYGQPIDYSSQAGINIESTLDRIDPSILDQAIKKANVMMRAAGKKNQQILASLGDDGEISYTQKPNVMQLDYIKRALGNLAEAARTPLGQATDDTLLYGGLARDLKKSIGDAVIKPETGARLYDDAVRLGGEKIDEQNAFKLGREALKPQTEIGDILDELGPEPSQAQIEASKLGMRQYIRTILENVKGVPSDQELAARQLDAFYRLTSSDAARKKIQRIMGNEAADLLAEIDKVAQTSKVRSAVAINSKTAQRQAIERDIRDVTDEGFVGQLLRGEPIGSAKEIVKAITGRTDQYDFEQRRKIFADVARALTEAKGPETRKVLDIMERAQTGQIITQAENDLLVNQIAGVLSLTARGALEPKLQEMAQ